MMIVTLSTSRTTMTKGDKITGWLMGQKWDNSLLHNGSKKVEIGWPFPF